MLDPSHVPTPWGHLDLHAGLIHHDGSTVRLSPVETAVLSVLTERPDQAVSEADLLARAWGYRTTNTRTVSVTMSRLRKKIERDPRSPRVLLTVRGEGYRFVPTAPSETSTSVAPPVAGRDEEIERVRAALASHSPIELVGVGGIGKSTLARGVLPEAVVVDLSDIHSEGGVLRRLSSALQAPGSDGRAAVRAALAQERPLILESAETLNATARTLLTELLAHTRALITSRQPLGIGRSVLVEGLTSAGAVAVVTEAREAVGLPPVAPEAVERLRLALGGHAMSLALAAPLIELEMLPEQVLQVPDDQQHTSRELIEQTLTALPEASRQLLDTLAAFGAASLADAAEVAGLPLPALLHGVHELRVRGLVTIHDGAVELHAFVRLAGASKASRDRHAAWVASRPLDPPRLREIRREVERALVHSEGDRLVAVLFRHLFVIFTYGPVDTLLTEVSPLKPRLPRDGRDQILWGMALYHAREVTAAREALQDGVTTLAASDRDDRIDWLVAGWTHLSFCSSWVDDPALDAATEAQLEALMPQVTEPTLAAMCRMTFASQIAPHAPDRAVELYTAIERDPSSPLEWQLLGSVARLRMVAPTRAEVLRVEAMLETLGPERLGHEAVAQRWIHVAQLWLALEEPTRARQLAEHWAPLYARSYPRSAAKHVAHTALYALPDVPLATDLLALAQVQTPLTRTVAWLLNPTGDPPSDDPELARLAAAYVAGEPIEVSPSQGRVSKALIDARRRAGLRSERP